MRYDEALLFAQDWVEAWNAHDLDRVLAHFTPDAVFVSPKAVAVTGDPSGRVVGAQAMRAYWTEGLRRSPNLRFELLGVELGIDVLVIRYRNHHDFLCSEVLCLGPDGRVERGWAAYATGTPEGPK